ncbi:GapR family DNA-binding domain-containing protein [Sulfitobacter sp. R18_1]|uniref:DUF2312 domain-containing protein n=1 Tax=Sulfitobacter sp. R18_1 TaxID=2821104 RepID=UPI001ADD1290|nr:GapR family DNA-binding domain-containing protein [Sulfitobacter sp. R18_1]MBO9428414.1 DUF2312 domain-containing protein [Sulfitobacter sp. R18_1]
MSIENGDELIAFLERIENLEEEKQEKVDEIKEVKAEVKGRGYDMKAFAALLKLRKQDPDDRAEEEAILDMYKLAVGLG